MADAAGLAWGTADAGPYRLFDQDVRQMIELAPAWARWLSANEALVRGYAKRRLCDYLQARNPGVPGIVHKLDAPVRLMLSGPRRWWKDLNGRGGGLVEDIYTSKRLDADFDVDHFLPWTFVAHDERGTWRPPPPRSTSRRGTASPTSTSSYRGWPTSTRGCSRRRNCRRPWCAAIPTSCRSTSSARCGRRGTSSSAAIATSCCLWPRSRPTRASRLDGAPSISGATTSRFRRP